VTVYVDEITGYGDHARRRGLPDTQWAHLTADTREELHAFARGIGLRREWFQNADNDRWHYDVTPGKRDAALAAGAEPIGRRALAALIARRRSEALAAVEPTASTSAPPPIVGAGLWQAVMSAAGYRCQCSGQCGAKHADGDGRCVNAHGGYDGKRHAPIRLEAAPIDPAVKDAAAVRLPAGQLMAWCPGCRTAVLRRVARARRREAPEHPALFEVE
jgi:hypothetical protein